LPKPLNVSPAHALTRRETVVALFMSCPYGPSTDRWRLPRPLT
jgi:hypothetical protein